LVKKFQTLENRTRVGISLRAVNDSRVVILKPALLSLRMQFTAAGLGRPTDNPADPTGGYFAGSQKASPGLKKLRISRARLIL
jgi:hypothetical protein